MHAGNVKNITLSAADDLIERARRRAESENTTLNALFRQWLDRYAAEKLIRREDMERLVAPLSYFRVGRRLTRAERNERWILPRHESAGYAVDPSDPRKHGIALDWIGRALQTGEGMLSYQVVQEWFNVVLRKSAPPLRAADAERFYRTLIEPLWRVQSSRELIEAALDLHRTASLSWWDAIIVAAAAEGGCTVLLSEDLQDGVKMRGLRIENPFRQ